MLGVVASTYIPSSRTGKTEESLELHGWSANLVELVNFKLMLWIGEWRHFELLNAKLMDCQSSLTNESLASTFSGQFNPNSSTHFLLMI